MTHSCPGCGKHGISNARLSCPRCWFRLPQALRDVVWTAYRGPGPGSPEHNEAIAEAMRWYAEH